jgi:hypothetical protein
MFWRDEPPRKKSSVLWAGSEVWDLYLGVASHGLARSGQACAWAAHDTAVAGVATALRSLRAQHAAWVPPRIRVWLSGSLARPFVLAPVAGLKGQSEGVAIAKAMAAEATGLDSDCEVWLAGTPLSAAVVSVAMPRQLRYAVVAAAQAENVRLHSLRPWWCAALTDVLNEDAATALFAAQDTDAVTVLTAQGNEWLSADTYAPVPAGAELEALITRRLFATGGEFAAARRVRLSKSLAALPNWASAQTVLSFAEE